MVVFEHVVVLRDRNASVHGRAVRIFRNGITAADAAQNMVSNLTPKSVAFAPAAERRLSQIRPGFFAVSLERRAAGDSPPATGRPSAERHG